MTFHATAATSLTDDLVHYLHDDPAQTSVVYTQCGKPVRYFRQLETSDDERKLCPQCRKKIGKENAILYKPENTEAYLGFDQYGKIQMYTVLDPERPAVTALLLARMILMGLRVEYVHADKIDPFQLPQDNNGKPDGNDFYIEVVQEFEPDKKLAVQTGNFDLALNTSESDDDPRNLDDRALTFRDFTRLSGKLELLGVKLEDVMNASTYDDFFALARRIALRVGLIDNEGNTP